MTLMTKVISTMLGLLFLMFISTYGITLINARHFFMEQINSDAKDTASSLGLSLSQALANHDRAMMSSMVEAVFDNGYFSFIEVRDNQGKLLISRYAPTQESKVPNWFVELVEWPQAVQSAVIMKGWKQVGSVVVMSDTNYACYALWDSAVLLFYGYCLFSLFSGLGIYIFMKRLLSPLQRVLSQAEAVTQRDYRVETRIPKTTELKKLTLAMNNMTNHVKTLEYEPLQQMEQRRSQLFRDPLSLFGNKRYLYTLINDADFAYRCVLLLSLDGSSTEDNAETTCLIRLLAKASYDFWQTDFTVSLARFDRAKLILLFSEPDAEQLQKKAQDFARHMQALVSEHTELSIVSALSITDKNQAFELRLAELEKTLLVAKTMPSHFACSDVLPNQSKIESFIIKAIKERQFIVYSQAIGNGQRYLHQELSLRIKGKETELAQSYFSQVAARKKRAHQIDLAILSLLFSENQLFETPLAIALTEETLLDKEHSRAYLVKLAELSKESRKQLSIEIHETTLINHFSTMMHWISALQKLDVGVGVHHVGVHFQALDYIYQLPIRYLKLHPALSMMPNKMNKQFLLSYFGELGKVFGIDIIATHIRSEEQWSLMKEMSITWGQGYFLAAPAALSLSLPA